MSQAGNPTTTELLERLKGIDGARPAIDSHRLLRSTRRRVTLRILEAGESPFELREVANAVARRESDGQEPTWNHLQRVEISLHHNHLPRMADYGVLTYDDIEDRIVPNR